MWWIPAEARCFQGLVGVVVKGGTVPTIGQGGTGCRVGDGKGGPCHWVSTGSPRRHTPWWHCVGPASRHLRSTFLGAPLHKGPRTRGGFTRAPSSPFSACMALEKRSSKFEEYVYSLFPVLRSINPFSPSPDDHPSAKAGLGASKLEVRLACRGHFKALTLQTSPFPAALYTDLYSRTYFRDFGVPLCSILPYPPTSDAR